MAYKQVKSFDQSKAGNVRGFCLRNVRLGYGIASKYDSAWQSWQNAPHFTGAIPTGVDVPVYFFYLNPKNYFKNDGHIGVRLANGKFWSDGKTYINLTAYRVTHPAVIYRGWSTEVNDVAVIKYVATTSPVYYTVKAGDTVTSICAKYGITITKFKLLNPTIKDINVISIGQKVRIK